MKYPKIRAEWEPIGNPDIDIKSQELKIYKNSELIQEYSLTAGIDRLSFSFLLGTKRDI